MMIPEGILQGTTNQRVFLNIISTFLILRIQLLQEPHNIVNLFLAELIAGYAWPGKPLANMMIKFYVSFAPSYMCVCS